MLFIAAVFFYVKSVSIIAIMGVLIFFFAYILVALYSYDRVPTTKTVLQTDICGLQHIFSFRRNNGNQFLISTAFDSFLPSYFKIALQTQAKEETYGVRYAPKTKEEEKEEEKEKKQEKVKNWEETVKEGEEEKEYDPIFGVVQRNCLKRRREFREEREKALERMEGREFSTQAEVLSSLPSIDRKHLRMVVEENDDDEKERESVEEEETGNGEDEQMEEAESLIDRRGAGSKEVDSFLTKLLMRSAISEEGKVENEKKGRARRNVVVNKKKYADYLV
jgi:hypothetical protein